MLDALVDDALVDDAEVVVAGARVTVVLGGGGVLVELAVVEAGVLGWVTGCSGISVRADDDALLEVAAAVERAAIEDCRPGTVTCAWVADCPAAELALVTFASGAGAD